MVQDRPSAGAHEDDDDGLQKREKRELGRKIPNAPTKTS